MMNDNVSPNTVFASFAECSDATGVPIEALKYANKHPDGKSNINGCKYTNRIKWDLLKPWLEANGDEINHLSQNNYDSWLALKTKYQALLAELEYEEKKERLIEKDTVHQLLKRISSAQSSLMNSKFRQELPPRLEGKNEGERLLIIDACISEYMAILNKELDKIL